MNQLPPSLASSLSFHTEALAKSQARQRRFTACRDGKGAEVVGCFVVLLKAFGNFGKVVLGFLGFSLKFQRCSKLIESRFWLFGGETFKSFRLLLVDVKKGTGSSFGTQILWEKLHRTSWSPRKKKQILCICLASPAVFTCRGRLQKSTKPPKVLRVSGTEQSRVKSCLARKATKNQDSLLSSLYLLVL